MRRSLARLAADIAGIFTALEGKPLPTPYNAWVWWQRRTTR